MSEENCCKFISKIRSIHEDSELFYILIIENIIPAYDNQEHRGKMTNLSQMTLHGACYERTIDEYERIIDVSFRKKIINE